NRRTPSHGLPPARALLKAMPNTDRLARFYHDPFHAGREGAISNFDGVRPGVELDHLERRAHAAALAVDENFAPRRDRDDDASGSHRRRWYGLCGACRRYRLGRGALASAPRRAL